MLLSEFLRVYCEEGGEEGAFRLMSAYFAAGGTLTDTQVKQDMVSRGYGYRNGVYSGVHLVRLPEKRVQPAGRPLQKCELKARAAVDGHILKFVEEACIKEGQTCIHVLRRAYAEWCRKEGHTVRSSQSYAASLARLGYPIADGKRQLSLKQPLAPLYKVTLEDWPEAVHVQTFIEECTAPGGDEKVANLVASYRWYCRKLGVPTLNSYAFGRLLHGWGYAIDSTRKRRVGLHLVRSH